jgi:hypothetical protein
MYMYQNSKVNTRQTYTLTGAFYQDVVGGHKLGHCYTILSFLTVFFKAIIVRLFPFIKSNSLHTKPRIRAELVCGLPERKRKKKRLTLSRFFRSVTLEI